MLTSILATFGMFCLAVIAKALTGDWLHPASFFCALWTLVCASAIIVAPENITSASGPLWILLNCALICAGSATGAALGCSAWRLRGRTIQADTGPVARSLSLQELQKLTIGCTALGIIYIALALHAQGIGIGQLTNIAELGKAAMRMSLARYSSTGYDAGKTLQLLLSLSYLAPLFGGTLLAAEQAGRATRIIGLISLLPSLLAFSAQSTRSSVVFGFCIWAAGYSCGRIAIGRKARRINRRAIAWVALAIPAGLLLISAGDILRGGKRESDSIGSHFLSGRTKTYMCGHVAALSQWMDSAEFSDIHPALGQYTFSGAYDLLHPGTRVGGVISEIVFLPTGPTNVYTYFRQIIQDVAVPGAILFVFGIAMIAGYSYRRVFDGADRWVGLLASFYGASLLVLTSIFNYNSIILAFTLYGLWWCRPWVVLREPAWAH